jgi:hypothetical protein
MMENLSLKDKQVLLILPRFFGYEVAVKDKFIEMGAEVLFFDDRPSNGFISKSFIRIDKRLLKSQISRYYSHIESQLSNKKVDIIILLNPEALPTEFLERCRQQWPDSHIVLYMWDSIKNRKHTLDFLPFCNRAFTFDQNDAALPNFWFKPLFCLDVYTEIRQRQDLMNYDLCFVGTLHSDRYAIAKMIKDWCDEKELRTYFFFFMQSQVLYYFYKYLQRRITAPRSEVSFSKLNPTDVVDILASSNVVLDIQHPKQSGLTMRTIETIGAGKKLITTNDQIYNYDFYDPSCVQIIDRDNPLENLDVNFFTEASNQIPERAIQSYEIGYWLHDLLQIH